MSGRKIASAYLPASAFPALLGLEDEGVPLPRWFYQVGTGNLKVFPILHYVHVSSSVRIIESAYLSWSIRRTLSG